MAATKTTTEKAMTTEKATVEDYFRLTRLHIFPLGVMVFVWPHLWALAMVAYRTRLPATDLLRHTAVFTLGATLLHCAACVLNDICDVDFDRRVERTKNRPLPAGRISLLGAWTLLAALVGACVGLLAFTNRTAALLGLIGLFPLHALYPLMKRWTAWPQAWLGVAIGWAGPFTWLAVDPSTYSDSENGMRLPLVDNDVLLLFAVMLLGSVCFTIVYDTQYACQDRAHDVVVGLRSTAVLFGTYVRPILSLFAVGFVAALVGAGYLNKQGRWYYAVACGGSAVCLAWQMVVWRPDVGKDCARMFRVNHDLGYVIWAGILLDYAFA